MERGDGMSYSEFTYPLLQAWDWWHMFQDRAVQIQIGGGDQYGNIIAGIDAVKHIAQAHAPAEHRTAWLDAEGRLKDDVSPMGLTVPLLTTSTGEKFGKTAGNAIWLDPTMTTPFDLYGFLLRSSDADVERYLHLFTFVPAPEIAAVMAQHRQDPGKRPAQHLLAAEVLELVHGVDVAARTRAEHQRLRAPSLASLATPPVDASAPAAAAADAVLRTRLPRSLVEGTPVARILYHAGLVESKSEGARMVGKGGVYVATAAAEGPCGGERTTLSFSSVKDVKADEVQGLVQDGLLVLRLGKWKVRVIEVVDDDDFDSAGGEAPGWTAYKEARGER
jgi:tyrosyl-tRNA synthetase